MCPCLPQKARSVGAANTITAMLTPPPPWDVMKDQWPQQRHNFCSASVWSKSLIVLRGLVPGLPHQALRGSGTAAPSPASLTYIGTHCTFPTHFLHMPIFSGLLRMPVHCKSLLMVQGAGSWSRCKHSTDQCVTRKKEFLCGAGLIFRYGRPLTSEQR